MGVGDKLKKSFILLLTFFSILTLCACSQSGKIPKVSFSTDSNAVVEYQSGKYNCHITHPSAKIISIKLTSPKNVDGLTILSSDGKYSLSFEGLMCKTESEILPETSFPSEISRIFTVLENPDNLLFVKQSNELYEFSGKTKDGNFKLYSDSEGKIKQISSETGLNLKIL